MPVFHYYRSMGGRRVRYRFTLTDTNDFVSDVPANDTQDNPGQPTVPAANTALLDQRGISYDIRTDGTIVVTNVPQLEHAIARFFTETSPCFFPGCEQFRNEWKAMLPKDSDEPCTDCEMGQLMNQFRARLEAPLLAWLAGGGRL